MGAYGILGTAQLLKRKILPPNFRPLNSAISVRRREIPLILFPWNSKRLSTISLNKAAKLLLDNREVFTGINSQ